MKKIIYLYKIKVKYHYKYKNIESTYSVNIEFIETSKGNKISKAVLAYTPHFDALSEKNLRIIGNKKDKFIKEVDNAFGFFKDKKVKNFYELREQNK